MHPFVIRSAYYTKITPASLAPCLPFPGGTSRPAREPDGKKLRFFRLSAMPMALLRTLRRWRKACTPWLGRLRLLAATSRPRSGLRPSLPGLTRPHAKRGHPNFTRSARRLPSVSLALNTRPSPSGRETRSYPFFFSLRSKKRGPLGTCFTIGEFRVPTLRSGGGALPPLRFAPQLAALANGALRLRLPQQGCTLHRGLLVGKPPTERRGATSRCARNCCPLLSVGPP